MQNRPRDKVVYAAGLKLRLISERGTDCERCGFKETQILVVHHKDRNREHNDLANLELICPNCHAKEHYLAKNWYKRYNIPEFKEKLFLKEAPVRYKIGEVGSGYSSLS
ncbi:MAG: HNH endonuclease [bacterium]|nr:HNH endonuclease [bacterium]